MANFQYIARSADGREVSGAMQADNETAVARTLDERQLFPVSIAEQAAPRPILSRRIRMRDVGVLYSQLGDLLTAGVPLMRALEILSRVGLNKNLADLVVKVKDDVSAGENLADAMAKHGEAFTALHCAMIRAGERAGFLEEVLTNLAGFIERQDELRSKVRSAMIYPAVLCIVGVLLLVVVLTVLVPKFKPLFGNVSLPLPTTILFALSDLMSRQLPLFIVLVLLAVSSVRTFLKSATGAALWDKWRLRIPLAGNAMRMVSITRFCRILGTMLANGVNILQALAISKDATGCGVMAKSIERAAENVRGGDPLAGPLKESGLFPPEIIEMIAIGEESNQLDKVLVKIADTVERRTNRQVDQAVRLVEPMILVVLACAIAFVAIGLLYPVFTMSQQFQ